MIYNIPGVYTSLIDRSYIQPLLVEGRSVLIAGFSKFGTDKFYEFADADEMEFTLGLMDTNRYGRGLLYGLTALTKTQHVIFKRLMPEDANYANLLFKTTGEVESETNVIDTDALKTIIDDDEGVELHSMEAVELEISATQDQEDIFWEYNPDNIVVFVGGLELRNDEFTAVNGQQIHFNTPLAQGRIINLYTVFDYTNPSVIDFANYQHIVTSAEDGQTTFAIAGGYDASTVWVTLNGLELSTLDYDATDGNNITFNMAGGLNTDDFFKVHSVTDGTTLGNSYYTQENIIALPVGTTQNVISYSQGYNPDFNIVSINGIVLGGADYLATDGYNIRFGTPLQNNDIVILHSATPGADDHYFGTMFAKALGEGYNDIYIQFRSAYDVEKTFADEEGDSRYRFNFLKAVVLEETANGYKTVSDEFIVSLIDQDPLTHSRIVSTVTGDDLYINTKFEDSNDFVSYYQNENYLPLFYEEINIADLTKDQYDNQGANRFILIDTDVNGRQRNIEYFIDDVYEASATISEEDINIRATSILGKGPENPDAPGLYVNFNNPVTGLMDKKEIISHNGEYSIIDASASTAEFIDYVYMDGTQSFYKATIITNPDYPSVPGAPEFILKIDKHTNMRQKLFDLLNGTTMNIVWNLQNGYSGDNLYVNGRLNMGYRTGNVISQDAKQLLIDFYKNNEEIHEVLYPELDFDYVPDWSADIDVANEIVQMADEIGFTMPLISEPRALNTDQDYKARLEDLYLSSYNTMIYSGQWNDNHYDETTGGRFSVPTSFYAMVNHLNVDNTISITEPVANIVKGQMPVAGYKLSHITKSKDIEKLRRVQINTIIKEIDGIYFIDQLTAYKSASKLSRANVMKPIHRMRKDLPKLLKDLLQRKATKDIIMQAKSRVEHYMLRWEVRDDNLVDGIFSAIEVTPVFFTEELKLVISIAVTPIGTIEKIEIPITVY